MRLGMSLGFSSIESNYMTLTVSWVGGSVLQLAWDDGVG